MFTLTVNIFVRGHSQYLFQVAQLLRWDVLTHLNRLFLLREFRQVDHLCVLVPSALPFPELLQRHQTAGQLVAVPMALESAGYELGSNLGCQPLQKSLNPPFCSVEFFPAPLFWCIHLLAVNFVPAHHVLHQCSYLWRTLFLLRFTCSWLLLVCAVWMLGTAAIPVTAWLILFVFAFLHHVRGVEDIGLATGSERRECRETWVWSARELTRCRGLAVSSQQCVYVWVL